MDNTPPAAVLAGHGRSLRGGALRLTALYSLPVSMVVRARNCTWPPCVALKDKGPLEPVMEVRAGNCTWPPCAALMDKGRACLKMLLSVVVPLAVKLTPDPLAA